MFNRILRLVGVVALLLATSVHAAAPETLDSKLQLLRQAYCAAQGGEDISASGAFTKGPGVGEVVACRLTGARSDSAHPNKEDSFITLPPFTFVGAALYPPSGSVTVAAANPIFNTSCAADIFIKAANGFPAVSHGTATINCRGYNSHGKVNGCSIDWSGPVNVTVGQEPYGGHVSLAFGCIVVAPGSIASAMNLKYVDPIYASISYSHPDETSNIGIVVQ
ncbi:hypothetical protein [Luteibacter sp. CQ10]|uniref:hypothetical protein n=1 Tax=Luteibacter sp. CQ10 TaxID=2805821 RepID=UPI0034A326D2